MEEVKAVCWGSENSRGHVHVAADIQKFTLIVNHRIRVSMWWAFHHVKVDTSTSFNVIVAN